MKKINGLLIALFSLSFLFYSCDSNINSSTPSSSESGNSSISDSSSVLPNDSSSEENEVFDVIFNPNNGTQSFILKTNENGMLSIPETPIKEGYSFDGWYTLSNEKWSFEDGIVIEQMTLEAKWIANNYSITLDVDGGTCDLNTLNVTYNEQFELPTPSKEGSIFLGWYSEETLIENGTYEYSKNITLKAKWLDIVNVTIDLTGVRVYKDNNETISLSDYTVAFDANGKVIFASCTASGYGGPADGFYHDGNYKWAAGETNGIYSLDDNFAPWPNVTADGVNAWTLYSVVVPEGCSIVTGTADQMLPIINKIFNLNETSLVGNSLLEGLEDGSYNHVFVTSTQKVNVFYYVNDSLLYTDLVSVDDIYQLRDGTIDEYTMASSWVYNDVSYIPGNEFDLPTEDIYLYANVVDTEKGKQVRQENLNTLQVSYEEYVEFINNNFITDKINKETLELLNSTYNQAKEQLSKVAIKDISSILNEYNAKFVELMNDFNLSIIKVNVQEEYREYEKQLLEEVNNMKVSSADKNKAKLVFSTTDITNEEVNNANSIEELNKLLEEHKLHIEQVYYYVKFLDTKDSAITQISNFNNVSAGEKLLRKSKIDKIVLEEESLKILTSREEVKGVFEEYNELVKIQLALINAKDQTQQLFDEYKTNWIDGKFSNTYSATTGDLILSEEEIALAESIYAATMGSYNWDDDDKYSSQELSDRLLEEIVALNGIKEKYVNTFNYRKAIYDSIAGFEELIDEKEDEVTTFAYLSKTEKNAIEELLDVVELRDLTVYNTAEEVLEEYNSIASIIENISLLGNLENNENKLVMEAKTLFNSELFASYLNPEQINQILTELDNLDSKYRFIEDHYKSTMTYMDLIAAGRELNEEELTLLGNNATEELSDLYNKYKIAIDTAVSVDDLVTYINESYKANGFSEEVGNNYGFEIRVMGSFINDHVAIPNEFTADMTKSIADEYLSRVNAISKEAMSLYDSFNGEEGLFEKINYVNSLVSEYGLTEELAAKYSKEMIDITTPIKLYNQIKEEKDYVSVINSFKDNFNDIVDRAIENDKAIKLGYTNKDNNIKEANSLLESLLENREVLPSIFVYNNKEEVTADLIEKLMIIVDNNNRVVFAQYTTTGVLPKPTDEYYSDGETNIFELGINYKDNKEDYKIVVPRNSTLLIVGDEYKSEIVTKIFNELVNFSTLEDGTYNSKEIYVLDLFDTYTQSMWEDFNSKLYVLIDEVFKASINCETVEQVNKIQEQFTYNYKATVREYEILFKRLDASLLEKYQIELKHQIELDTIEARDQYKELDLQINRLRVKMKDKVDACEYSYNIAEIYDEFLSELDKLISSIY